MAHVFLSYPILGKPEMKSVYAIYQSILSTPHTVRFFVNENDSLISRVRNVHISNFLNDFPECTHFMSIDSDIEILNAYHSNNIFNKLVSHDLDFVGGLYALKNPNQVTCSSISIDGKTPEFDSGLAEMKWLSSGCWCVKRSVVEKMVDAYPELTYDGDDSAADKKVHGLYIPMLYDLKEGDFPDEELPFRKYLSEDWSFSERWKAIGGKIFADTSIALRHIGRKDYELYPVRPEVKERPSPPPAGFDLEEKGETMK